MNALFQAAEEIQNFLSANNLKFCFIGGIALMRWGQMRLTNDLDLTLQCGFGNEILLAEKLLKKYNSRISDPLSFAQKNRIVLLSVGKQIPVDVALSGLLFEDDMICRASFFELYPGVNLFTCSAEDLIIMKSFANRDKDWSDIEGIITRQGDKLNKELILENVEFFSGIKEDPEIINRLLDKFNRP